MEKRKADQLKIQVDILNQDEKIKLGIESPHSRIRLSKFFDKRFSLQKSKDKFKLKSKSSKNIRETSGRILKKKFKTKDSNFRNYFQSKMYCRLMHTKRGHLWNEWHKLDEKRVRMLMNEFVIKKDYEAMEFIMSNYKKEKQKKTLFEQKKQQKIDEIKNFKVIQKNIRQKKLKNLEDRNFNSMIKYLEGTIDVSPYIKGKENKSMTNQQKLKIANKNHQIKKRKQKKNINNYYLSQRNKVKIGQKSLFEKLSKINQNIFSKVYDQNKKKLLIKNKGKYFYSSNWIRQFETFKFSNETLFEWSFKIKKISPKHK